MDNTLVEDLFLEDLYLSAFDRIDHDPIYQQNQTSAHACHFCSCVSFIAFWSFCCPYYLYINQSYNKLTLFVDTLFLFHQSENLLFDETFSDPQASSNPPLMALVSFPQPFDVAMVEQTVQALVFNSQHNQRLRKSFLIISQKFQRNSSNKSNFHHLPHQTFQRIPSLGLSFLSLRKGMDFLFSRFQLPEEPQ